MRIIGTPLTSGPVTPGLEAISGGYRYQGRPGWPDDPGSRDDRGVIEGPKGGAKVRAAERVRRTEEYARLRNKGKSPEEARAAVGVAKKTGDRYEADWKAGKTGEET